MPSDVDRLRSTLVRLTDSGDVVSVEPLDSGTTGPSFLVEAKSGRWVAKVFAAHSSALLGPAAQYDLLRRLAESGIAPRPVSFDAEAGVLITEFVGDARPATAADLQRPSNIVALAALLGALHRVCAPIPAYVPQEYVVAYVSAIGGRSALSAADRARLDELDGLVGELTALDRAGGVCHNDLAAENILLGRQPKLIDFDYAVLGPPILDLASVSVMNDLSDSRQRMLLDAYFADGDIPFSLSEFARVQRLLRLTAHFWSLALPGGDAAAVEEYRIRDD